MKFFSKQIVHLRYLLTLLTLAAAVLCGILIPKVTVNYDMSKYLSDDSSMKQGLELMQEQFGTDADSNTVRVMFSGLSEDEIKSVYDKLGSIKNVSSVAYENGSEEYNKDGYTLFILSTDCEYNTPEETAIENTVKTEFSDYTVVYKNGSTTYTELPLWILLIAVAMVLVILFVMCGSWIEPVLLSVCIGAAVVINLGTNIIFASVSSTTLSLAAILQLILSIDYSVILMNRYKQERTVCDDKRTAMESAVHYAFSSISSSALTTIVGLLALLFMSFKIGQDLGLVLAKGVLCSLICNFTLLPNLVTAADKLIKKTTKKTPTIPTKKLSAFSYKYRYAICAIFAVMFVGSCITQSYTGVAYSIRAEDKIADVFPLNETTVLLYETKDEEKIHAVVDSLESSADVKSVYSYYSFTKEYTAKQMEAVVASLTGEGSELSGLIGVLYYDKFSGGELPRPTLAEFITFLQNDVLENPLTASYITDDMKAQINSAAAFTDAEKLTEELDADGLAAYLGMDIGQVKSVIKLYNTINKTQLERMSPGDFVHFITRDVLTNIIYSSSIDKDSAASLRLLDSVMQSVIAGKTYTSEELYEFLGGMSEQITRNTAKLLLLWYGGTLGEYDARTLSILGLFEYLTNDVLNDPSFSEVLSDEVSAQITAASDGIKQAEQSLRGDKYSRVTITTEYLGETDTAEAFFDKLNEECSAALDGKYYIIGDSAMSHEMKSSVGDELLMITLLTAAAVFVVIAIMMKSIVLPFVIVLIIQCGVYITVTASGFSGSIYFLALLIVECILMGATVDYGILFTNYYRESRAEHTSKEALADAYLRSVATILTSGLVMIIAAFFVGFCFEDPTVAQICMTLSLGAFVSVSLILFVLPGIIAATDRKKKKKEKSDTPPSDGVIG